MLNNLSVSGSNRKGPWICVNWTVARRVRSCLTIVPLELFKVCIFGVGGFQPFALSNMSLSLPCDSSVLLTHKEEDL
jgi:hypothetical protein